MSNSSDFSFSFRKRRLQFKLPVQPHRKQQKKTVIEAVLHIKTLSLPLISTSTGQLCESLSLEPYKPYTIGRKFELCDFIFSDRRVSKIHCQLYFDSLVNKIYFSDGLFLGSTGCIDSFSSFRAKISTNGAFVNGSRISGFVELRVGDLVWLVCGNEKACSLGASVGFLVEKTVFVEEIDYKSSFRLNPYNVHTEQASISLKPCRVVDKTSVFLNLCRVILCSDDPVSYIQKFVNLNQENRIDLSFIEGLRKCSLLYSDNGSKIGCPLLYSDNGSKIGCPLLYSDNGSKIGCPKRKRVYSREIGAVKNCCSKSPKEVIVVSELNKPECSKFVSAANANSARQKSGGVIDIENVVVASSSSTGGELFNDENCGSCIQPPGKKFYLNRLKFISQDSEDIGDVVSLPELFNPIEGLKQVFIATFTSDISWFLTYCKIPPHLPVTIACHSAERCWSSDPDKRTSVPFSEFPNLTVVYPPFPEVIAFNNDRKNSGIACHHPKLIVLQREDKLRVVVTSANLVEKQWLHVSNTVWWQDFPRLSSSNCFSLFTQLSVGEINVDSKCDFGAQLAGFMASLVVDVPSQAHWILELTKYDFEEAAGYLVASVPGIHLTKSPYIYKSKYNLVGNTHKLQSCGAKFLSSVEASVVGLSHIFRVSADSNGEHLKKLASFLGKCHQNMDGMSEIVLRRETNIPADENAVSVFIPNPEEFSAGDSVQLGFLPRNIAKWVAPLSDIGLFSFAAYIFPKEVLETAVEGNNKKVKLILYVYAGSSLSSMSEATQLEYASAICSLVASSQRYVGLWRMKEILGQYKWPEHLQSEFLFGSSSVGCVNAQFLAAFAAAAGKTSMPFSDSEESDPEWGCWTASQELKNPSIRIIFPRIERVKTNRSGIMASRLMLCFSQKTWQRLENVGILHDAIPHPRGRVGFPMHVKVGRRRFQYKNGSSSGWVYCGSHNFSAAAWGRPISERQSNGNTRNNSVLGSRLHVSNYELGIIFIVPPSDAINYSTKQESQNLDDIVMPFVVPPPKYGPRDRPATAQAMREALKKVREVDEAELAVCDLTDEGIAEEEEEEVMEGVQYNVVQEKEDEKAYADKLWTQLDSSET